MRALVRVNFFDDDVFYTGSIDGAKQHRQQKAFEEGGVETNHKEEAVRKEQHLYCKRSQAEEQSHVKPTKQFFWLFKIENSATESSG